MTSKVLLRLSEVFMTHNLRQGPPVSISHGLHVDEEMVLFRSIVGAKLFSLAGSRSMQEELIKYLQLMKMRRNFGEISPFNCFFKLLSYQHG